MNLTNLINFQSMIIQGAQTQTTELNTFVANSIRVIVEEFFLKMAPSFIIVVSCRRRSPLNFYLNILQHLFNMVDNMIVQLVFVDFEKPQRIEGPRLYTLLLVDSFDAFLDIDLNSYTYNYDINEYHYIFLMQRDRYVPGDMDAIFQYCWTYNMINCNIQTQNAFGEVYMHTYFPYKQNRCGHTAATMINQFVNDSWINQKFFLPKLRNLYGCPLVAIVRHIPPFLNVEKQNGRIVAFSGFEMSLLRHLARRMNFTLDIRESTHDDRYYPYGSGTIKLLADHSADFVLGYYRKRSFGHLLTTTFPHYQNNIITAIYLEGHTITTFEVLSFPFKKYSWTAITVGCIIMMCLTRLLRSHRRPGSIATLSMIASTLGLPIIEQPKVYQSTVLFTSWLWSTLILRSIYSGTLYYLFSNVIYSSMPTSFEDAVNQSYHTVMNRFALNDIKKVPYYERYQESTSVIFNSTDEFIALPFLEKHLNENLLAIISQDFLIYYVDVNHKPGQFYILPEILLQQQLCIYLSKHSFLINQFDAEIIDLQAVGLMGYWSKRFLNFKYFASTYMHGKRRIEQDDLWGIYMICGVCHLISSLVCIIEKLSIKFKCLRKFFE